MIIDYNYKPHVEFLPLGATIYVPRSKNNKGFIYFNGVDNDGNGYLPTVICSVATGGTLAIALESDTCIHGSISDSFMQFKRDPAITAANTRTTDIAMFIDSTVPSRGSFYPINYLYMTFDTLLAPTIFLVRPLVITLY